MIHTKLEVWQRSINLVATVYQLTNLLPGQERFGLSSQMRRAAVSIPANISEGAARKSTKEFLRYLEISNASLAELETYFVILEKLGLVKAEQLPLKESLIIRKMLFRLKQSLTQ